MTSWFIKKRLALAARMPRALTLGYVASGSRAIVGLLLPQVIIGTLGLSVWGGVALGLTVSAAVLALESGVAQSVSSVYAKAKGWKGIANSYAQFQKIYSWMSLVIFFAAFSTILYLEVYGGNRELVLPIFAVLQIVLSAIVGSLSATLLMGVQEFRSVYLTQLIFVWMKLAAVAIIAVVWVPQSGHLLLAYALVGTLEALTFAKFALRVFSKNGQLSFNDFSKVSIFKLPSLEFLKGLSPVIIWVVVGAFQFQLDKWAASFYLPIEQFGLYYAINQVAFGCLLLVYPYVRQKVPVMATKISHGEDGASEYKKFRSEAVPIVLVIAPISVFATLAYTTSLSAHLGSDFFWTIFLLQLASLVAVLTNIENIPLVAAGAVRNLLVPNVLCLVVSAFALYIFLDTLSLGIVGASAAALFSQLILYWAARTNSRALFFK